MTGCFGNSQYDRQLEREVMRHCDEDDFGGAYDVDDIDLIRRIAVELELDYRPTHNEKVLQFWDNEREQYIYTGITLKDFLKKYIEYERKDAYASGRYDQQAEIKKALDIKD